VKEELYAIADSLGDHDYDHSKVYGMYGKREELKLFPIPSNKNYRVN
jgi:hypothetical protein